MELVEAIKTRRSIRQFKPDPVPEELIKEVIETALWAPSGMNTQPWKVIVVSGEKRNEFNATIQKAVNHINERLKRLFPEKMQKRIHGYFKDLGGAPHIIVVVVAKNDNIKQQETEIQAGSALMQNLCLVAHDKGLGTCWMSAPLWIEDEVMDFLGMKNEWKLVAVTPLGYPDQNPPVPPRKGDPIIWIK
ncbi:MAG TPA: nitroreductase family protein [Clostridia bacterium]|nr:nitroreductase family protein [Clostridia bacterium]